MTYRQLITNYVNANYTYPPNLAEPCQRLPSIVYSPYPPVSISLPLTAPAPPCLPQNPVCLPSVTPTCPTLQTVCQSACVNECCVPSCGPPSCPKPCNKKSSKSKCSCRKCRRKYKSKSKVCASYPDPCNPGGCVSVSVNTCPAPPPCPPPCPPCPQYNPCEQPWIKGWPWITRSWAGNMSSI